MENFKYVTIESTEMAAIASGMTNDKWFYINTKDNIVAFLKDDYYEKPDNAELSFFIIKEVKGKAKSLFISEFIFNMQYQEIDDNILNIFRNMQ